MDGSREQDLRILNERRNDGSLHMQERRLAHLRFERIQAQMKDKTLTKLREMLVCAMRGGDADTAEKLELQIKDHSRKQWWYEKVVR